MNKLCWLIGVFFTCMSSEAQNLVPNGDFEQYSGCPTGFQQIDSTLFWFNPSSCGTPDYFNQCANPSGVGVPDNYYGFQQGHSGGGYSGIVLYSTIGMFSNSREYIEVPLLSPLISSQCYHFEMYVSLANYFSSITTDDIGVYFSNIAIIGVNNCHPLPYTPQIINSTGFFTDTLNWTLVSGDYTALGGESYLIIGNFKNDFNTDTLYLNNTNAQWIFVFIDDVSLSICTGINELKENSLIIFPNPFSDNLNIYLDKDVPAEITLYDIASRKIMHKKFTNSVSLNTEPLAKGLYLYEVRSKDGSCKKGKVVKD
jgi:hypothetical protein